MSLNKSQKTRSCLTRWVSATTLLTTIVFSSVFPDKAEAHHCGPLDITGTCLNHNGDANTSEIIVVPSDPLNGVDKGYAHLPKASIDANGDGRKDYCRFIGNAPNIFIACALRRSNSKLSDGNNFSFRSISGVDQGYDSLPRGFRLVDGKAAYCRFVGNAPNIFEACNLTTSAGFSKNQFGYRTGRTAESAIRR
jgi:hypothetical protein